MGDAESADGSGTVPALVRAVVAYLTRVLRAFGLIDPSPKLGFALGEDEEGAGAGDREAVLGPLLDALRDFRTTVREAARTGDVKAVLAACDSVRDDALPRLGVRLEDKGAGDSRWKLEDADTLVREMSEKKAADDEKAAAKRRAAEEREAAAALKEAKLQVPGAEMFLGTHEAFAEHAGKFSKFDDKGVPTHDVEGNDISKGQAKKLNKAILAHEKLRAKAGIAGAAAGGGK